MSVKTAGSSNPKRLLSGQKPNLEQIQKNEPQSKLNKNEHALLYSWHEYE